MISRWQRLQLPADRPIDVFRELRTARRILIAPNDRVGGVFMGTPVYKAIRESYPQAHVALLAGEKEMSIAARIPFIDEVLRGPEDRPVWCAEYRQLVQRLRTEKYDLAICLGPDCSFRLSRLCGLSGARLRVGFHREGIVPFNFEIVARNESVYEGDQYLSLLGLLGLKAEGHVSWKSYDVGAQRVRERYLAGEFSHGDAVGLDLTRGEGQGFSIRQLDDIVGRVIERGARAVLFFSLAERKHVDYLTSGYGDRVLPFAEDDLSGVAAALEGCRALISCNTDVLHLAMSLRIPAIGVFDEDVRRWISENNESVEVLQVRDVRTVSITEVAQALDRTLGHEVAGVIAAAAAAQTGRIAGAPSLEG
ncbi:MAG: glycosyltransferase family 9 protein [Candidatus Latescibacterota bacterium]|nr:glycosyltransferase family 9 protein [Candidatus Latescibacterota bacterium]